jgi:phosphate transport system substrate-binding protein
MRFFDWAFARGGPAANGLDYVPIPSAAVALIAQVWADSVRDSLGQAVWKPHRQPAAEGSR